MPLTMSANFSFRFLDLPPEIREKVYILVSKNTQQPRSLSEGGAHVNYPTNLLLTSHQLYDEARFVYFTVNRFSLKVTRHTSELDLFLSKGFKDARRMLQRLDITIFRWGKHNWFTHKFMPIIEDCVLYGRLREMNVRVRKVAPRDEGILRGDSGMALKQVLEDPYLDKVNLEIYWHEKGVFQVRNWTAKLDRGDNKELGIVREWNGEK